MESEKLYAKYNEGKHWEQHPTIYALRFANFLKENNFWGSIVDVGCGDGRDAEIFLQTGFDVLGIDNSETVILEARKKHPNLEFQIQNAENLSFKENSVGALYMINVIHYLKKEKAIREILRVMKPGGYFFIHFNEEIRDKFGNIDYCHDAKEIMGLISDFAVLEKNEFEREDQKPVVHSHKVMELILQKIS